MLKKVFKLHCTDNWNRFCIRFDDGEITLSSRTSEGVVKLVKVLRYLKHHKIKSLATLEHKHWLHFAYTGVEYHVYPKYRSS